MNEKDFPLGVYGVIYQFKKWFTMLLHIVEQYKSVPFDVLD